MSLVRKRIVLPLIPTDIFQVIRPTQNKDAVLDLTYQQLLSALSDVFSEGGSLILLKTNGTDNPNQNILNLVAGTGVTLDVNDQGDVTINSFGGSFITSITDTSTIDLDVTSGVLTGNLVDVGTAGTYGSGTQVPQVTIDSKGRVTNVQLVNITAGAGTVTSVGVNPGTGINATISGTSTINPTINITNTAPDVIVGLTGGNTIGVSGAYPNFTLRTNVTTTQRLLGRYSAGAGAYEEIIIGTNLTLSGNTLSASGSGPGSVTSVSGTTNRISASPTTGAVVIDIDANYVGQSSINTVGTIGAGTWQGTAISDSYISSAVTWNAKQAALNGTGVVKSTSGTISYINGTSSQFIKGDGSLDGSTYLTDAPSDGTTYGRKNGAWSAVTSSSGGIPHGTAAGTDTYTVTITGATAYADGDAYLIRFTNGNTTGATLNINDGTSFLGAKDLYRNNDGVLIGGDIIAGGEMLCVYNPALGGGAGGFQLIGTSPNTLLSYVTNADSVTITKGMPVYAFGGVGDRMTVKRAFNTSDATSAQTVGLVLSASIGVNQKGLIIMQGLLDGLSILPTATWNDGDAVYLGTTAGSITPTKQYAPNHLVYLGFVTTASNGAAGRMYVRVQNGYELDELHNVQARTPADKDTLYYDNTVTPKQWKTASISTILGYTPLSQVLNSANIFVGNGSNIATAVAMSGDATLANTGAVTIANNAVTLAKFQQINTSSFLGRVTAATGNIEVLSGTQATTILDVFSSSLKGLAPSSGGGTTNFLRADGTWAVPGGSAGNSIQALTGDVTASASSPSQSVASTLKSNLKIGSFGVTVDGVSSTIQIGQTGFVTMPYDGVITGWSITTNASGSIQFDVWKAAGAIPTVANSIVASAPPTLTTAQFVTSTTLTGWTTTFAAGDVFGFYVNSVSSTVKNATLTIRCTKS